MGLVFLNVCIFIAAEHLKFSDIVFLETRYLVFEDWLYILQYIDI